MTNARHDFIPRNDAQFMNWYQNLCAYIHAKTDPISGDPAWKAHIPPAVIQEMDDVYFDWVANFTPTLAPHTPVQTVAKNNARRRAEAWLRPFIQRFLYWPPVMDEDRAAMQIPNHDKIRTPQPVPSTVPEIETNTAVIRRLRFRMRDFGAKRWGKPPHVHTIEFRWEIRPARPAHVDALTNIEIETANPVTLLFEDNRRGDHVFFAARWLCQRSWRQPRPRRPLERHRIRGDSVGMASDSVDRREEFLAKAQRRRGRKEGRVV